MPIPEDINQLIEEYRDRCLWFLRADYVPETTDEMLHVLDLIERYGDRSGYERVERIRIWLLHHSKAAS